MDIVFRALADPTRRILLDRLHEQNGQSLSDLATGLGMTRQAVSQHLALLEQANLVASVWHGREKLHYLNPVPIHEVAERWLSKYEQRHLGALSDLKRRLEGEESQSDGDKETGKERTVTKPEVVYITYIATTPDQAWAALTGGEFTRQYWYDRRIESAWRVGAPVRFFDGASNLVTDSGVVLECDPPRQLAYTFRNEVAGDRPASGYSRVRFTLEAHERLVKLTLIHDELPDEETANGFREGWSPILSSLKTFLETGQPLPQLRRFVEQGRVGAGAAGGAQV